jgi:hypothetical protein
MNLMKQKWRLAVNPCALNDTCDTYEEYTAGYWSGWSSGWVVLCNLEKTQSKTKQPSCNWTVKSVLKGSDSGMLHLGLLGFWLHPLSGIANRMCFRNWICVHPQLKRWGQSGLTIDLRFALSVDPADWVPPNLLTLEWTEISFWNIVFCLEY